MKRPRKAASAHTPAPAERRILDLLRRESRKLDTGKIARRLRRHPNGVRLHLQRLERSGLVERTVSRDGVGRPRDQWRLAPRALAEADLPYTGWAMARALARVTPSTPARLREVEATGRELGAELARNLDAVVVRDPRESMGQALAALGFEPQRSDEGDSSQYKLLTCPYADVVKENPAVVCRLHKGLVGGVLESIAPDAKLTGFEARPPEVAGCLVDVKFGKRKRTAPKT